MSRFSDLNTQCCVITVTIDQITRDLIVFSHFDFRSTILLVDLHPVGGGQGGVYLFFIRLLILGIYKKAQHR